MNIDFKKIVAGYAKDQQKVFSHDRSETVGASEVFDCIRKSFFKKVGAKVDADYDQSFGATSRGDILENFWIVPAIDHGLPPEWTYIGAGEDQKTFIDLKNRISATPDGLVSGASKDALALYGVNDIEGDCFVVEIKSVDPRVNLEDAKKLHQGQAIIQMGLIREQTNYQPNYAVIVYVNASFVDDVKTFPVKFDQSIFENGKKRAHKVFASFPSEINETEITESAINLMAEGKLTHSCDFCQFTEVCSRATKNAMPEERKEYKYNDEDRQRIYDKAKERTRWSVIEKEAEENKKKLEAEIKDDLRNMQVRRVTGDKSKGENWTVSYTWINGRSRLDLESLKSAYGIENVEDYMTEGEGHERLTVTLKSGNKKEE